MGLGDNLLGSGMARGAAARGKKIAFGDGKIRWDSNSETVFRGNPNVATPGSERWFKNLEWIPFYKGHRLYNKQTAGRWHWNYDFRPIPGEIFLSREEKVFGQQHGGRNVIVVEPNVPAFKSVAQNKQWPFHRYENVAAALKREGYDVIQFGYPNARRLPSARWVSTPSFRFAMGVLARVALYIGPEGGLHHGAAVYGTPGVVLFGGFIPPQVTGYDCHTNLTGGAEACGTLATCEHCKAAMEKISVEEVLAAAIDQLARKAA